MLSEVSIPHFLFQKRWQAHVPRYKSQGATKTETGQPDRCEFFSISQDDLLGNAAPRAVPEPISASRSLLASYLQHGRFVLTHILRALATQLGLPEDTFVALHSPTRLSGSNVRLIRNAASTAPAEMRTSLLPHTDIGSVTLLANVLGGLQVLAPGAAPEDESAWGWVRPQPGCLIVNMGDAMVEWTGGVLRSAMHRVGPAPGGQRTAERISVAMLFRPDGEASMCRLTGGRIPSEEDDRKMGLDGVASGVVTAAEWERKKAVALQEGKDCARSRGGRELGL